MLDIYGFMNIKKFEESVKFHWWFFGPFLLNGFWENDLDFANYEEWKQAPQIVFLCELKQNAKF